LLTKRNEKSVETQLENLKVLTEEPPTPKGESANFADNSSIRNE
jgi:hypothetical protein